MGNGCRLMRTRDASGQMTATCSTRSISRLPRQKPDDGRWCADYSLEMARRRARGHGAPEVMLPNISKQALTHHSYSRGCFLDHPARNESGAARIPDDDHPIFAARAASSRGLRGRRTSTRTSVPCCPATMPRVQSDKTCSSDRHRGSRPGMPSGQRSAQPPTRSHAQRDEMPDRNAHARLPHEDVCRPTFPPPHPFLGAPQRRRRDGVQRWSYLSWCRHQTPFSSRPRGARSSHGYMPQSASSPRA